MGVEVRIEAEEDAATESDREASPVAGMDDAVAASDKDVNALVFHDNGTAELDSVVSTILDDVDDVFDSKLELNVAGSLDVVFGGNFGPDGIPIPLHMPTNDSADPDTDVDDAPICIITCDGDRELLGDVPGEGDHLASSSMLSMEGRPHDISASSRSPSVRTLSELLRPLRNDSP